MRLTALILATILSLSGVFAKPAHRGLMIDTSRHFPSVTELTALLPELRAADINVLHLHLTDGPGWRFESKVYPRLTSVGAWRVDKTDRPWNWRATEFRTPAEARPGEKIYGGFYTQADCRKLSEEAKKYGIRLIPEIDIPGHAAALMLAYPALACPTNRDPKAWFHGKDVLCVGNPATLKLIDTVIGELCEAFPGAPIHIGCDEVPTMAWDTCPLCKNPAVRKVFYTAVIDCVRRRGREVFAWDDLRSAGIPMDGVTLTCWHDDAALRPQDIACPYSFCYLDQPTSVRRLPFWRIPTGCRGWQLNLWTEEMPTRAIRTARIRAGLNGLNAACRAAVPQTKAQAQ